MTRSVLGGGKVSGGWWRRRLGSQVSATRFRFVVLRSVLTCLAGPKYILKSWPEGYKMFIHYKGPQDNPRTDKYLFGTFPSTRVIRCTS